MRLIGNILWFVFGGFISGMLWIAAGLLCCITIIGIPVGKQCFKYAGLSFFPFGKDVELGGGFGSLLLNIIWIVLLGWEMAVANILFGIFWCITIVGIPFGRQFFKFARLSLLPFGAKIVRIS